MTRVSNSSDDRAVSLMALDQYFRLVHRTAPVSREEEVVLLECVHRGQVERTQSCPDTQVLAEAQAARDRLVEGFQGLVASIASRLLRSHACRDDLMDLIQDGNVGLFYAIETSDPQSNLPLRALAGRCIRWAILEGLHLGKALYLPERDRVRYHAVAQTRRQLTSTLGREPTVCEVAHTAQVDEQRTFLLLALQRCGEVDSLEALAEDCEVVREEVSVMPLWEAEQGSSCQWSHLIRQAVATVLRPREREVIELRYGLGEQEGGIAFSSQEIAARLGVGCTRVASLEQEALRRLRGVLADSCGLRQRPGQSADLMVCEGCGEQFPRRCVLSRFCSDGCRRKAVRRQRWGTFAGVVVCEGCGEEFTRQCARKRFCSEQCQRTVANRRGRRQKALQRAS